MTNGVSLVVFCTIFGKLDCPHRSDTNCTSLLFSETILACTLYLWILHVFFFYTHVLQMHRLFISTFEIFENKNIHKHEHKHIQSLLIDFVLIITALSFLFPAPPPPSCEAQVDLCFVIDSSGSIRDNNPPGGQPDNWELQLQFLVNLVNAFTIGPDATRVGAIVFSEEVILEFTLSQYDNAREISEALRATPYLGQTTNTPEALRQTRLQCFNTANGDRRNVPNLAIVVTDGVPHPPERRTPALDEATALKNTGADIISIGITTNIDEDFLKGMSSAPQLEGRNYFTATDFGVLNEIQKTVVTGTCETIQGEYPSTYHLIKQ